MWQDIFLLQKTFAAPILSPDTTSHRCFALLTILYPKVVSHLDYINQHQGLLWRVSVKRNLYRKLQMYNEWRALPAPYHGTLQDEPARWNGDLLEHFVVYWSVEDRN